eukprot:13424830-Ditylum_brightwellii.AAC.1
MLVFVVRVWCFGAGKRCIFACCWGQAQEGVVALVSFWHPRYVDFAAVSHQDGSSALIVKSGVWCSDGITAT